MHRLIWVPLAAMLASVLALAVPDAVAGAPPTMAETARLRGEPVDPDIPIDYVGVQWEGPNHGGAIRFRHGDRWGRWEPLTEDGVEVAGTFASALMYAGDADAYEVRVPGRGRNPRAVAINTTDAARPGTEATAGAAAPVIPRSGWQADESLMTWAPQYYGPAQKITVHHTATRNADPDPAATLRAIYRYHAVDRGFGDIGYHFLIDEAGRIYEGRYSGTDGDPAHAGPTSRDVVTAAHVGGFNSANLGIALLGTLTSQAPTAAAQQSLEQLLADLAGRHGIDPTARSTYVNPVNGVQWTGENIPGHRDWEATECPGGGLYALLPTIRSNAKARLTPTSDTRGPAISAITATPGATTATIRWTTDEPASTEVHWRRAGTSTWTAVTGTPGTTSHRVDLSGLSRRTKYEYRVRSVDAAGNATQSTTLTFQTKK